MRRLILGVALVLVLCGRATPQQVRFIVRDSVTTQPIPGALLTARSNDRSVRGRFLTDSAGRFDLRRLADVSTVTVEFVGYAPRELSLAAGIQTASVLLAPAPFAIASVEAKSKGRCGKSGDTNIANAWYAARAVLGSTRATRPMEFRVRQFDRQLDMHLRPVNTESMSFFATEGSNAYRAATGDSLAAYGFVRGSSAGRYFYGPDADLILSDEFVEHHCFGVARDSRHPELFGLEFWPAAPQRSSGFGMQQRDSADIRGVMWLDPSSNALKTIEFTFTGLKDAITPDLFSGRIDFDRISDGSFILRRWYIRLPVVQNFGFGVSRRGQMVPVGLDEGGGEVLGLAATDAHADVSASLDGVVFDSINQAPLANAIVYLAGTQHRDTTDSMGRFSLTGVSTGVHYVGFFHPLFANLAPNALARRLELQHGRIAHVTMALPSAETMLRMLCTSDDLAAVKNSFWKGPVGVLTGHVRLEGRPIEKAKVVVQWQTLRHVVEFSGDTDNNGVFKICGLPAGQEMNVRITSGAKEIVAPLTDFNRVLARDFELQ